MKRSILLLCLLFIYQTNGISEKQMKATMKLLRNTCQNKVKVSSDIVDAMHKGDFSQGQCYVHCLLETYKFFSNGEFAYEDCIKLIKSMAPPEIGVPAIESVNHCKDAIKTKNDLCKGSAELAECIYNFNPEGYWLP